MHAPPQVLAPGVKGRGWLEAGGQRLVEPLWVAVGMEERTRGLLGCDGLRPGTGLLIPDCRLIHTFGMRFSLDLVFLDGEGRVICVKSAVPPRRLAWGGRRACHVLEVAAGWLKKEALPPGLRCQWQTAYGFGQA